MAQSVSPGVSREAYIEGLKQGYEQKRQAIRARGSTIVILNRMNGKHPESIQCFMIKIFSIIAIVATILMFSTYLIFRNL